MEKSKKENTKKNAGKDENNNTDDLDLFIKKREIQNKALKKIVDMNLHQPHNHESKKK